MNYETRAVSLWLNNDEGLYSYWKEVAEEFAAHGYKDADGDDREDADIDGLAERLEEELSNLDNVLVNGNDMYSDMLTHALCKVDWKELAKDLLDLE